MAHPLGDIPKRVYFKPEIDIVLLKQVLYRNPWGKRGAWAEISQYLKIHESFQVEPRTLRDRIGNLLFNYRTDNSKALRRSGTNQQYEERDSLLEELNTLHKRMKNPRKPLVTNRASSSDDGLEFQRTYDRDHYPMGEGEDGSPREFQLEIPMEFSAVQMNDNQATDVMLEWQGKMEPDSTPPSTALGDAPSHEDFSDDRNPAQVAMTVEPPQQLTEGSELTTAAEEAPPPAAGTDDVQDVQGGIHSISNMGTAITSNSSASTPNLGATSTPNLGATSTPNLGATSTPNLGAISTPTLSSVTTSSASILGTAIPSLGSTTLSNLGAARLPQPTGSGQEERRGSNVSLSGFSIELCPPGLSVNEGLAPDPHVLCPRRVYFRPHYDIMLLREVLLRNPYGNKGTWNTIADELNGCDNVHVEARSLRERVQNLLTNFRNGNMKALRRSGTEEEYEDRDVLLRQVSELEGEWRIRRPDKRMATPPTSAIGSVPFKRMSREWPGDHFSMTTANSRSDDLITVSSGTQRPREAFSASMVPRPSDQLPSTAELSHTWNGHRKEMAALHGPVPWNRPADTNPADSNAAGVVSDLSSDMEFPINGSSNQQGSFAANGQDCAQPHVLPADHQEYVDILMECIRSRWKAEDARLREKGRERMLELEIRKKELELKSQELSVRAREAEIRKREIDVLEMEVAIKRRESESRLQLEERRFEDEHARKRQEREDRLVKDRREEDKRQQDREVEHGIIRDIVDKFKR